MKKKIKLSLSTAFPDQHFIVVKIAKRQYFVLWQNGKNVSAVKVALDHLADQGITIYYLRSFSPSVAEAIILDHQNTLANSPLLGNDLRAIFSNYHENKDFSL